MHDPKIQKIAADLVRELSDKGRLVEGGWKAYEFLTGLQSASAVQRLECRKAYFFGAQHLFASILGFLESGEEATEADLRRMDKVHAELEQFIEEQKKNPDKFR